MTVGYLFYSVTASTMADPAGCGIIPNGAAAVKGDRITGVGENEELIRHYSAHRYIDGREKFLMSELVDAHMHTGISIYKGFAQDAKSWMSDCVFSLKGVLSAESGRASSTVMVVEATKADITIMVDSSEDMLLSVDNHIQAGVRAQLSHMVHGLPFDRAVIGDDELYPLEDDLGQESLKNCRASIIEYHDSHNGRIICGSCPLGLDRISRETLQIMKEMSDREGFPAHLHLTCGERGARQMQMRYGERSVFFLHEPELVNRRLIAVHLSMAGEDKIRFLAGQGVGMVLCSGSKATVDRSVPPAFEFSRYSPRLAIGPGQTSGGSSSNLFCETKTGALLNKCRFKGPSPFQAWKMLRLTTIDGARTMGMGHVIGSLESGRKTDMIMLGLEVSQMTPLAWDSVSNLAPNLVYAVNGNEVQLPMVNGRITMEDRMLLGIDEERVMRETQQEGRKLPERVGRKFLEKNNMIQKLKKENKL